VYIVKDSTLVLEEIDPVYFSSNKVVIKGLEDGEKMVSAPVPGAYPGKCRFKTKRTLLKPRNFEKINQLFYKI
tara:strand:+ start:237 stop:455 length:219 start_codon:yes stop_codon:yes gene_type:complete